MRSLSIVTLKGPADDADVGRWPWAGFSLARLWCGIHTEVSRCLGSTRNGVTDLGCDLELVCNDNEAVLSKGRKPEIHIPGIWLIYSLQ